MDYKNYLNFSDKQYDHLMKSIEAYHHFDEEETAEPKIIIYTPTNGGYYTTEEIIASPEIMLKQSLESAQAHIDVGDDSIPTCRVEFGTGQVSHAFGCDMYIPEDSPVCAGSHIMKELEEVDHMEVPALDAGWFGKSYEYTKFFLENKPDVMGIELPDFQSPFNNAHLVRGNDIFYDFYDDPERVDKLLGIMAEYQTRMIKNYRELISAEEGYFYDWGMIWKGSSRLSNCSVHMISTEFYEEFIKKHDSKLLQEIGGGRIHYCGEHDDGVMASFSSIPGMSGIDYDGNYHDFRKLAGELPKSVVLLQYMTGKQRNELLNGDWGNIRKNNVVLTFWAPNAEEGKEMYKKLKESYQKSLLKYK